MLKTLTIKSTEVHVLNCDSMLLLLYKLANLSSSLVLKRLSRLNMVKSFELQNSDVMNVPPRSCVYCAAPATICSERSPGREHLCTKLLCRGSAAGALISPPSHMPVLRWNIRGTFMVGMIQWSVECLVCSKVFLSQWRLSVEIKIAPVEHARFWRSLEIKIKGLKIAACPEPTTS